MPTDTEVKKSITWVGEPQSRGATDIGGIKLDVPPLNITYSLSTNAQIMQTMRQPGPNIIKTGRDIVVFQMDIIFSGQRMINNKLAPILAMIRRTPFLTIANETVSKLVVSLAPDIFSGIAEIPIAISGYSLQTLPSLPDSIMMNLSFLVYNYAALAKSWQYLSQGYRTKQNGSKTPFDENGNLILQPAISAAKSNLWSQFWNRIVKDKASIGDFMFEGEVPVEQKPAFSSTAHKRIRSNPSDVFTSRADVSKREVLRNGGAILKLDNRYPNSPYSFSFGYHVDSLHDALNLNYGAYKSSRTQKWVYTEKEEREDIVAFLKAQVIPIDISPSLSLAAILADRNNFEKLDELPVYNIAARYLKRVTIGQTSTRSFMGISVRHACPLSILPILSSPVPTIQYLGGSHSDIEISYVTTDENDAANLNEIFMNIEKQYRNAGASRLIGSMLVYFENDIANLNGTFVVANGDISIQSIRENPGSYMVSVKFQEQSENAKALGQPEQFSLEYRRQVIEKILTDSRMKQWTFDKSIVDGKYHFDSASPSFIETMVIPTFARIIRNAYIQYKASDLITGNDPKNSGWVTAQSLMSFVTSALGNTMLAGPAGLIAAPAIIATSAITANKQASDTEKTYGDILTHIWRIATGQVEYKDTFTQGTPEQKAATQDMMNWLGTYNKRASNEKPAIGSGNQFLQGAIEVLNQSDSRRLAYMLRSPKLWQYEQEILGKVRDVSAERINTVKNDPFLSFAVPKGKDFDFPDYTKATAIQEFEARKLLSCYPDLGVPFRYTCMDEKGLPLLTDTGNKYDVLAKNPAFYLADRTIMDTDGTKSLMAETPDKIDKRHNESKINSEENVKHIFGAYSAIGGATPSNSLITSQSNDSSIDNFSTYINPDIAQKTGGKTVFDKSLEQAQKLNDDLIKQQINNNDPLSFKPEPRFTSIGTFSQLSDLLNNVNIMGPLTLYGEQTSKSMIDEAQLEHKFFKSTFKDFNPSIDKTVSDIIYEARKDIYTNPKYYSMDRAYPTYKIYFKEENTPYWFLFDTYFDYKALESVRVYREKGSPTTRCQMVLNDHDHILSDIRALFARRSFAPGTRNTNERLQDPRDARKPMQSLFLTPGTQVQVRLGYASDPFELKTVFNGFIADLTTGDQFQIYAESYGVELLQDSGMGGFMGWICPPKQFIWMMLLDSKVKHFGTLFQPSVLPTGMSDYFDWFSFDDNLYISDYTEPNKVRALQSYDATGMTKWDVLQDIAAAHPGYICQTAIYDDRETIFFGRPHDNYSYTSDLGEVQFYPEPSTLEAQKALAAAGGWVGRPQMIQSSLLGGAGGGLAPEVLVPTDASLVYQRQIKEIQAAADTFQNIISKNKVDNLVSLNGKYIGFNYLQWMPIKQAIEDVVKLYYDNLYNDYQNNGKAEIVGLIQEYCKCVDTLSALDTTSASSGNIQYDLYHTQALAPDTSASAIQAIVKSNIVSDQSIQAYEKITKDRLKSEGEEISNSLGQSYRLDERMAIKYRNLKKLAATIGPGYDIEIVSGWRDAAAQETDKIEGHSKAHFGQSAHSFGLGFDIDIVIGDQYYLRNNPDGLPAVEGILAAIGTQAEASDSDLKWGGSFQSIHDPAHFELKGFEQDPAAIRPTKELLAQMESDLNKAKASPTSNVQKTAGDKIITTSGQDIARLERDIFLIKANDKFPRDNKSGIVYSDLIKDPATSDIIKGMSKNQTIPLNFFLQDKNVRSIVEHTALAHDPNSKLETLGHVIKTVLDAEEQIATGTALTSSIGLSSGGTATSAGDFGRSLKKDTLSVAPINTQSLDKASEAIRAYNTSGDREAIAKANVKGANIQSVDKIKEATKTWGFLSTEATDIVISTNEVYKKVGIQSPMAIYMWARIASILLRLKQVGNAHTTSIEQLRTTLPGTNIETAPGQVLNPGIQGISIDIGDAFITLADRQGGVQVQAFHPGVDGKVNNVLFTGDIFSTNLQTHRSLRNIFRHRLDIISPEFQKLLAIAGHAPTKKRFRQYHIALSSVNIVANDIKTNFSGMWNKVKLKYRKNDILPIVDYYVPILPSLIFGSKPNWDYDIQAGHTLDIRVIKERTEPVENAHTIGEARNYATSILAEGVRKMYAGTLTILGNPDIKPYDIVYVYDDYSCMYGPIEVKSVNHVMSAETGYITIIEPHCYVEPLGIENSKLAILLDIIDPLLWFVGVGEAEVAFRGALTGIHLVGKESLIGAARAMTEAGIKNVGEKVAATKAIGAEAIAAATAESGITKKGAAILGAFGERIDKSPLLSKLVKPTTLGKIGMYSFLATAVTFHIFAGKDDDNYACPLNITPLSYRGEPFVAGLEGLTHESGIWTMINGELNRFRGSLPIVMDAMGEWWSRFDIFRS